VARLTGIRFGPRERAAGARAATGDRDQDDRIRDSFPRELRFRRGIPYRLHLVNAGKEGHDFSTPDFFTSVQLKNTDALNESGASVFLQPGQTIDIYFIAQNPGLFAARCADHDWAGMTAAIVID
jgi:uncharacterized cupredoxin-like copper-binding protein